MARKRNIVEIDLVEESDDPDVRTPKQQSSSDRVKSYTERRWTRSMFKSVAATTFKAAEETNGLPPTTELQLQLHSTDNVMQPQQESERDTGSGPPSGSEPESFPDDSEYTSKIMTIRLCFSPKDSSAWSPRNRSRYKSSESDAEQYVQIKDGEVPTSSTEVLPQEVPITRENTSTNENVGTENITSRDRNVGKENLRENSTESTVLSTGVDGFTKPALDKNEALGRWPNRYPSKTLDYKVNEKRKSTTRSRNSVDSQLECINHYTEVYVDGNLLRLYDFVHVHHAPPKKAGVARIIELYETSDNASWCRLRWFYRPEETVLGRDGSLLEDAGRFRGKLLFWSKLETDEPVDCLVDKVEILHVQPESFRNPKWSPPEEKYYYTMGYTETYSTFYALSGTRDKENRKIIRADAEYLILDLYCGCGGMSTGLCMGARMSHVQMKTRWAVDNNASSCESFRANHTDTQVYNCPAQNFLLLIKKWDELCEMYVDEEQSIGPSESDADMEDDDDKGPPNGEYEVEDIIGVRWSDTAKQANTAVGYIQFKVKWKGYNNPEDETWEPEENLRNSSEILKKFILSGRARKILPRPGECDVICGGPPCQGVSGMNRFRHTEEPLSCDRNRQVIVYMDIVEFLKPRFMLMENVVDILRFSDGIVGRYALTRLVQMQYQAKLGLMAAGKYGVPQYRQRIFLWGAAQDEILPAFPLPTHEVETLNARVPVDFKKNEVKYEDEEGIQKLHPCVTLGDALTDLPPVDNFEEREELEYLTPPTNSFQIMLRRPRSELEPGPRPLQEVAMKVLDHRPWRLNEDDVERTCLIPKKKGASFRDLPGVKNLPDGTVDVERENRVICKSGKPLVPDFTLTLLQGKNWKSFGRLWWDETVGTVYTEIVPHSLRTLHPNQDRTLSIRECARLQGFPDYYKFCGTVKDRFRQVGNAVSVPIARALGHSLGRVLSQTREPVYNLPADFS